MRSTRMDAVTAAARDPRPTTEAEPFAAGQRVRFVGRRADLSGPVGTVYDVICDWVLVRWDHDRSVYEFVPPGALVHLTAPATSYRWSA